ncbi:hypothetical protein C0995_007280 [Termitomyces sp. Mi166|nr:hypothetical protein C0995_007280 [Termitomyces sp. Mi166\
MDNVSLRLEQILDGDPEVPLILPWMSTSPDISKDLAEHIAKLEIPTINGRPCMLLHGIGQYVDSSDSKDTTAVSKNAGADSQHSRKPYNFVKPTERKQILSNIFTPSSTSFRHAVLLNTAGAGKSRLVLEGLCINWGFYITCGTNDSQLFNEVGSSDIRQIISDQYGYLRAMGLKKTIKTNETLSINNDCAERCFQATLCARLLVFVSYLRALSTRPDKLRDAKKIWMLLQTRTALPTRINCFLAACLHNIASEDDIYCVIDEAQTAADTYKTAFRSDSGTIDRPVLRAMLSEWKAYNMKTIVTGTSLERDSIVEALGSSMGKRLSINSGITDTGAWAKEVDIRCYLGYYLPDSYLKTHSGEELVNRACYWLSGRPRFVAAFVQYIVDHNFQSYHRLLTRYITDITSFVPNDAQHWESDEPKLPLNNTFPVCPFDFIRATKLKGTLLNAVQEISYKRLLSGDVDYPYQCRTYDKDLVECGFARYPGVSEIDQAAIFDNPLAYLAAEQWITNQDQQNPKSNGLEMYTALIIADIFENPTKLSRVFSFSDMGKDQGLANREARLVSCWYDKGGEFRVAEVFFPMHTPNNVHLRSPSNILGYRPGKNNPLHDLQWLRCEVNAPFLFSHQNFGPDLMFRLRLEDSGELITVALQVKWKPNRTSVTGLVIDKAVSSVTPAHFWMENTKKGPKPFAQDMFPDLIPDTIGALDGLCKRFNSSRRGYHSLIRGIFFFPATPNSDTCEKVLLHVEKAHEKRGKGSDLIHEFFVLPSDVVKRITQGYTPSNGLQQIEDGVARRLHEIELDEEDRKRAAQKEDRELYELWDSFTRWEDVVPNLKINSGDLIKMSSKKLAGQLILHRRLEYEVRTHEDRLKAVKAAVQQYHAACKQRGELSWSRPSLSMEALSNVDPDILEIDTAAQLLSSLCPDFSKNSIEVTLGSPESFARLLFLNQELLEEVEQSRANGNFDGLWECCLQLARPRKPSKSSLRGNEVPSMLDEISSNFQNLVNGRVNFPYWTMKPTTLPDVATLDLDSLLKKQALPRMLSHDLGGFQMDPTLSKRVSDLFHKHRNTFLVNASATGKTRLLYEGLCRNWGLYFTAHVDDEEAKTLHSTLQTGFNYEYDFVRRLPKTSTLSFDIILAKNREIANRRFSVVLLVHLLIFRDFLKTASSECGEVREDLQPRWLLAQVWHRCLRTYGNVYGDLLVWPNVLEEVRVLLPESIKTEGFFIVIDEANVAITQLWRSDKDDTETYPALKEIINVWTNRLASLDVPITFVVAGTEIPTHYFPPSSIQWNAWRWSSNTGAFDTPEVQKNYLHSFLPLDFVETASGQALIQRTNMFILMPL